MSDFTLQEAIDLAGGPVTDGNCPPIITANQLDDLERNIAAIGQEFGHILDDRGLEAGGAIALTMSSSFSCKVRRIDDFGFAILVPLGVPARLRVLARLLLTYWSRESFTHILRSPLDNVPFSQDAVPPLLRPLFLEGRSTHDFWGALQALDESVELDPRAETDVNDLMHLAVLFLLCHEFTHILHGHFDLLAESESATRSLSGDELRRGIEIDADMGATVLALSIQHENLVRAQAAGQEVTHDVAWLRLAYAVTMTFAISDVHRQFFGEYDSGSYNHPLVRLELFLEGGKRCWQDSPPARERFEKATATGWSRCVMALENLQLDVMGGAFGALPPGTMPMKVHTLNYGATPHSATHREIVRQSNEAVQLMHKVRQLLPMFADGAVSEDAVTPAPSGMRHGEVDRQAIGVHGVDPRTVDVLRTRFGEDRVRAFEMPSPMDAMDARQERDVLSVYGEYAEAEEAFLDSVNHVVVRCDGLAGLQSLLTILLRVFRGRIASVMCICDEEFERLVRAQMQACASVAREPTAEELEAEGKLTFVRDFDLRRFEQQTRPDQQTD